MRLVAVNKSLDMLSESNEQSSDESRYREFQGEERFVLVVTKSGFLRLSLL